MVKHKRTSKSFLQARLGEVERYGLLALGAMFLLLVGFLFEEIRVLGLESPEITLRTRYLSLATEEEAGATSHGSAWSDSDATPGGGESDVHPAQSRHDDFDFFEPPVSLPGRSAPRAVLEGATLVTVRSGDTLSKIAARVLGDENRWRDILSLNDGIDPKRLSEGQVLSVPVALGFAPVLEEVIDTAGELLAIHEVKDNEVLAKIAEKYYGRRSREDWLRIQEANRDVLKNVNVLKPGITLRIPALPAR